MKHLIEVRNRERAKHAVEIEELRRTRPTKRNEKDGEKRRAIFAIEMVEQRRTQLTKSNEVNRARFTNTFPHAFTRHPLIVHFLIIITLLLLLIYFNLFFYYYCCWMLLLLLYTSLLVVYGLDIRKYIIIKSINVLFKYKLLYRIKKWTETKIGPYRPQPVSPSLPFIVIYTYIVALWLYRHSVIKKQQHNIGVYDFKW